MFLIQFFFFPGIKGRLINLHYSVFKEINLPETLPFCMRTVVIAPGHGGHDVGAVGH